jgi:hypothetical protein
VHPGPAGRIQRTPWRPAGLRRLLELRLDPWHLRRQPGFPVYKTIIIRAERIVHGLLEDKQVGIGHLATGAKVLVRA